MKGYYTGIRVLYGMEEFPKSVLDLLPHGQVKIKRRNTDFVRLYWRGEHGVKQYAVVQYKPGVWSLMEQGSNERRVKP